MSVDAAEHEMTPVVLFFFKTMDVSDLRCGALHPQANG
ncbi:hypothetical protein SynA1825c_01664 [Synechococcus sp. A18-25c]|nr:hypothetical protein SynA1825c_01664 [Synechococcus sp. A18-25c]